MIRNCKMCGKDVQCKSNAKEYCSQCLKIREWSVYCGKMARKLEKKYCDSCRTTRGYRSQRHKPSLDADIKEADRLGVSYGKYIIDLKHRREKYEQY